MYTPTPEYSVKTTARELKPGETLYTRRGNGVSEVIALSLKWLKLSTLRERVLHG